MKKYLLLAAFLVLAMLISSCTDEDSVSVHSFNPQVPKNIPIIDSALLKSGQSYVVGYANGNIRSNMVIINWKKSVDSEHFLCYKVHNAMLGTDLETITDINKVTDTLTGLSSNTIYRFMIATILDNGSCSMDTVEVKTPLFRMPSFFGAAPDSKNAIRLDWFNNAESASKFKILRSVNNNSYAELAVKVEGGTALGYTVFDTNVTSNASYSYKICALNNYESTEYAEMSNILFKMDPPTLTSFAQLPAKRGVSIQWTDNANAELGYRVYRRSATSTSWALLTTIYGNMLKYDDNDTVGNLQYDSTYLYRVVAFNEKVERYTQKSITIKKMQPAIAVDVTELNFTNIAPYTGVTKPITITNTGLSNLVINSIARTSSRVTVSTSSFSLPPGSSKTIDVTVVATDTIPHYDTITINNNASDVPAKIPVYSKTGKEQGYAEGFESYASGDIPPGWSMYSNYKIFTVSSDFSHSGTKSFKSTFERGWYYSRTAKNFTGNGNAKTITFYYKTNSVNSGDQLTLSYRINSGSYSSKVFTLSTSWQKGTLTTVPIPSNATLETLWEFYQTSSSISSVYIDDILVQ